MTRRLILVRHAKSGWDNTYADDHARTLADSGKTDALALGKWLADSEMIPDLIVTSDAMRALQTAQLIKKALGTTPPVQEIAALYHAAPDTICKHAKAAQGNTIVLVGHNPGIAMAADLLAAVPPKNRRFADYPTCATTVLDFTDEAFCKHGQGKITAFITPDALS